MEVPVENPESPNQIEKERLALVEKRVDIQKKRIEIKKEKLNIDEIIIRRNIALEEQKIFITKISELRSLLSSWTIDDERTIMASEPFLVPILVEKDREFIIKKLIELIKQF